MEIVKRSFATKGDEKALVALEKPGPSAQREKAMPEVLIALKFEPVAPASPVKEPPLLLFSSVQAAKPVPPFAPVYQPPE
jgi:hypothetical protein